MPRARFVSVTVSSVALSLLASSFLGASCNRSNTANTAAASEPHGSDSRGESNGGSAAPPTVTEVNGVDLHELARSERELLWAVANDELSPCGDPHSIAVCARDHTCATCVPALRFLARRVQEGLRREELGELVRTRYARSAVTTIRLEGAPVRGPAAAPVTIVEFSDYECPHCGRAAPILRDMEREFEGRVRVIHMNFPLSMHIHAVPAARAAIAAGRQNKFWEYHDLLFQNQAALEPANLERYATQVGIDLARFRADMQSPETETRVQADRREGERLQIQATPTIFINGRRWPDALPFERAQLREWINEELNQPATARSAQAPSPSPSASPH
jgi:protein-disulfide isomerase